MYLITVRMGENSDKASVDSYMGGRTDLLNVPSGPPMVGILVPGVEYSLPLEGGKSQFIFGVHRYHLRARGSVTDRCKQKSEFPIVLANRSGGLRVLSACGWGGLVIVWLFFA